MMAYIRTKRDTLFGKNKHGFAVLYGKFEGDNNQFINNVFKPILFIFPLAQKVMDYLLRYPKCLLKYHSKREYKN